MQDFLQSRNPWWSLSPQWCYLCKNYSEYIDHVFLSCQYSKFLRIKLLTILGVSWNFDGDASSIFKLLDGQGKSCKWKSTVNTVILAIKWGIWMQRNRRIFEDKEDHVEEVWEFINYNIAIWLSSKNKWFKSCLFSNLVRNWSDIL